MRGSQKFCQRGSNSDVFLVDEGRGGIKILLKAGQHGPSSEMPLEWRLTLNAGSVFQGIRTSIAKKPCIFMFFQGVKVGSPDPLSSPLNPRMGSHFPSS